MTPDIVKEARRLFGPDGAAEALELLEDATLPDRETRCLLRYSCGDLGRLRYLREIAAIDPRDVIMLGEYEVAGGQLIRVWDLMKPFVELPEEWRPVPSG